MLRIEGESPWCKDLVVLKVLNIPKVVYKPFPKVIKKGSRWTWCLKVLNCGLGKVNLTSSPRTLKPTKDHCFIISSREALHGVCVVIPRSPLYPEKELWGTNRFASSSFAVVISSADSTAILPPASIYFETILYFQCYLQIQSQLKKNHWLWWKYNVFGIKGHAGFLPFIISSILCYFLFSLHIFFKKIPWP